MRFGKSILLGSAAGLVAVAGAQAADLPVKAKPVEYVRVCSTYGAGFFYIPGTDSCIRIGGYMRSQWTINGDNTAFSAASGITNQQRSRDYFINETRGAFSFDVRNNTQYGVMRAYFQEYITTQSVTAATPALQTAYVQLAGFTAGRFLGTYYTAWDTDIGSYTTSSFTGRDTSQSAGVEYRAQFGNGISAAIGAFDPRRSGIYDRADTMIMGAFPNSGGVLGAANAAYHLPDIQADVRVEQAWGGVHFGALLHENNVIYNDTNRAAGTAPAISTGPATFSNNGGVPQGGTLETSGAPKTRYGYSLVASVQLKQLGTGAGDSLVIAGQYGKGALTQIQGSAPKTACAIFGPGNNSGFYNSVAFGYYMDSVFDSSPGGLDGGRQHLTTGWSINAGFTHYWIPSVLRTSFYGHYQSVSYDDTAKAIICSTPAFSTYAATGAVTNFAAGSRFGFTAGSVCDPNFKQWIVGSRTAWNITPDLEISGDVAYQRYDTASSGSITGQPPPGLGLPATGLTTPSSTLVAGKPTGPGFLYNIADQGQFIFISRLIRSW